MRTWRQYNFSSLLVITRIPYVLRPNGWKTFSHHVAILGRRKCREEWPSVGAERAYNLFLDGTLLLIPLLLMSLAYSLIAIKLWRGLKLEIRQSSTCTRRRSRFDIRDIDVTVPIFASNPAASASQESWKNISQAAARSISFYLCWVCCKIYWTESLQEISKLCSYTITLIINIVRIY